MANHPNRKTAAEVIATHFCSDIQDWRESRYQPTRYTACPIFTSGEYYYSAPTANQKLPKEWDWSVIGEQFGRKIYRAHMIGDSKE